MNPRLLRPTASGFSPRSISGLVAWFDADDVSTFTLSGTAVSEWRDKSGNGYAVSQGTGNNQPARTGKVKGRATIEFDGTNDVLFSTDTGIAQAYNGDKSVTVFVVGEMQSSAEYSVNPLGVWFSFGSTSSGTPFLYIRSAAGAGTMQMVPRNDAGSTAGIVNLSNVGPAYADPAGDFFIASVSVQSQSPSVARVHTVMTATGDSITPPRNLQGSTTTSAASRPSGNTTVNRFSIGALGQSGFSDHFPARISEVIIYSRILSDSERARVVALLGKKYNVTTSVL